ncbi:DUF177 domain-containing protein [Paracrocinitomix mangrovi]|uniref:YceD family protein n=1 Tax=Paracrocinitomix mangrovi TaxID=2862509 RepID=UPI001C8ECDE0|nr:DUF177 domain-containing protein [Paracrocinitomix mangrovi]UKN00849.1 DUF177 domain-containing protein [Paracrocinitomix mangrovi]
MKKDLLIQFSGLSDGLHHYDFQIGDAFFEQLDYTEISRADLEVKLALEKKPNMLILNFQISGKVEIMCDKCTDNYWQEVNTSDELIYKFGDGDSDDEKIILIPFGEVEIDITQPIYELTVLSLPNRRVHPEGQCDPEMLEKMDEYLLEEMDEEVAEEEDTSGEDETDPRWEALKKLKK